MAQTIRVVVEVTVEVKVDKDSWSGHKEAENEIMYLVKNPFLDIMYETQPNMKFVSAEVTSTDEG